MKNAPVTKKILIIMIVLTVIVFGLYAFAYFEIKQNTSTLVALGNTAADDTQKDETLHAIKASLAQNEGFIGEIDSFFIPDDGVVGFINTVEDLGKRTGVSLNVGTVEVPQTSAATDFKEPLHLELETEGSWKNNYYFLSTLENLPYVLTVNSVSFTLSSAAEDILYKNTITPRTPGSDESWKGSYDITVLKLKHS